MIHTPTKYYDFLTPDQSLQLQAIGITDKTAFYWLVDKSTNMAKLRYTAIFGLYDSDNYYHIPAYSIACLHSLFPTSLVATTDKQVEIKVNDIYVQSDDLRDAFFKLIFKCIKEKHFELIQLNLGIHEFNISNYES